MRLIKSFIRRSLALIVSVGLSSVSFKGLAAAQTDAALIKIVPSQHYQTMDGFGVNFNGTYFRDSQRPMIEMLVKDLGATLFRLDPYGLTNWEAVNDNDDANVIDWQYFNDRYSIPEFEAAWAAGRYLKILARRISRLARKMQRAT